MATLESRNGNYRVIFRYADRRDTRSLRTSAERSARNSLARLEDNLRRLELGTLELPDDVDVAAFLLSDGRTKQKPKAVGIRTLGDLLKAFLTHLPAHFIEQSTRQSFEIHIRHLQRVLGRSLVLGQLQLADLQRYVNQRAKDKGIRGRTLSPATIKMSVAVSAGTTLAGPGGQFRQGCVAADRTTLRVRYAWSRSVGEGAVTQ